MVLDSETAPVNARLTLRSDEGPWWVRAAALAAAVRDEALRTGVAVPPPGAPAGPSGARVRVRWSPDRSRATVAFLGAVALDGEGSPADVGRALRGLCYLVSALAACNAEEPT